LAVNLVTSCPGGETEFADRPLRRGRLAVSRDTSYFQKRSCLEAFAGLKMDAELAALLLPNALGALINELLSDSAVAGKGLQIVANVIDIAETSGLDLSW
jgi:hypothetical protein